MQGLSLLFETNETVDILNQVHMQLQEEIHIGAANKYAIWSR
jgi:hypothetical protein